MPATNASPTAFPGFAPPDQNWFRMPNNWTDITSDITSLAELKVIEYVLRHTWGYQEYGIKKRITIDEFMSGRRRKDGERLDRGTGLSKPSVVAGLRSAVEHGYLQEEKDTSDLARIKKFYCLNMLHDAGEQGDTADLRPDLAPDQEPKPTPSSAGERIFTPDVKDLNTGGKLLNTSGKDPLHRTEKDTLERQLQKDTNSNNMASAAAPTDVVVALSNFGVGKRVAQELVVRYAPMYIEQKIKYLEFLLSERPQEIHRPAAWLRRAVEEDYGPPDGYVSVEEREQRRQETERQAARDTALVEARQAALAVAAAEQNTRLQRRRKQYGVTDDDIAFWAEAREAIRDTTTPHVYERVANTELLQLSEVTVRIGVHSEAEQRQLAHPGSVKAIERTLTRLAGRPLALQVEVLG